MVAYANRHAFSYVPSAVREQRKERKLLNHLENRGVVARVEPYLCRVCGRRFYNNEKLINHFKQIHEREQAKRLNQIESARGKRRVKLVGDELKRAGYWVRMVSDKPQAADTALRNHIVDMMDKRRVGCVVLVSDDSDFVDVLREAKLRCLKTVVVGDSNDGVLKRTADAGFSWKEVMLGKAKKEGASVVGRWKDRDILKRLEWTYNPEMEKKEYGSDGEVDFEIDDREIIEGAYGKDDNFMQEKDSCAWWELDSDSDLRSSKSH
ncbi:hypothetical protein CK203_008988 [Vitis vinifera]|uniref:C2H2-type domain-containing protein n=1 Tax=Vitis vinifera TaxID=29760 RepID=A0A438K2D5_VITVI|nr:hypothetical protein CK203_008988 [Vitis vinifera]